MAIAKVYNPPDPGKRGGGGLWGKVGMGVGTLVGAGAGLLASGGNPMGAMTGASLGGSVGQLAGGYAGEKADPSRAGGARPETNPIQGKRLNIAMDIPEVQMAQMQRSKELLAKSNVPNAMDHMKQLEMAQMKLQEQLAAYGTQIGNGGLA